MLRDEGTTKDLGLKEGFFSRETEPFLAGELVKEKRLKMLGSGEIDDDEALFWTRKEAMEMVARWNSWPWKGIQPLPL